MKKVSIIIPCYNVEQYLERCYQSLIHQSIGIENLELIFVNDASPDHSMDKLLQFEQQYPDSIIVIDSKENLKQGGARNLGLSYASAEYIGYVDPDDWVDTTMFEKLYLKAKEYDVDVISCEGMRAFTEDSELPKREGQDAFYIIDSIDARRELIVSGLGTGGVWSKLYKKSFLLEHQIFFPEHLFYEDNYFSTLLLMYVERVYLLNETLYYYFVNINSTIVKNNSLQHFDRLEIALMTFDELEKRGFFVDYYEEIEYNFFLTYYLNSIHIFLTRFDELPLNVIRVITRNTRALLPNIAKNPYNKNLVMFYQQLLQYLPYDLPDEEWQKLMIAYNKNK